jgi:hypothetical protein
MPPTLKGRDYRDGKVGGYRDGKVGATGMARSGLQGWRRQGYNLPGLYVNLFEIWCLGFRISQLRGLDRRGTIVLRQGKNPCPLDYLWKGGD